MKLKIDTHLLLQTRSLVGVFAAAVIFFGILNMFVAVRANVVAIPFWDEWPGILGVEGLRPSFDMSWILGRFADHRIAFTKLFVWLLYRINLWDVATGVVLNLAIYIFMIASLLRLYMPLMKGRAEFSLFVLPLFSGVLALNVIWPFQSCFHFTFLFGYVAIYFGFLRCDSLARIAWFSVFCVASAFALSPPMAIGVFATYLMKEIYLADGGPCAFRRAISSPRILVPSLLFGIGLGLLLLGQPHVYGTVPPWDGRFLNMFVSVLYTPLTGITWTTKYPVHMTALALLFVSMLLFEGYCQKLWQDRHFQALVAIFAGSGLLIAAIAFGRGSTMNRPDPQHLQPGLLLIPCVAVGLHIIASRFGWLVQRGIVGCYAALLVYGYAGRFNMTREFEPWRQLNEAALSAATAYYLSGGPGVAAGHPYSEAKLDRAMDLRLAFVSEIMKKAEPTAVGQPLALTTGGAGLKLLRRGWSVPGPDGVRLEQGKGSLLLVHEQTGHAFPSRLGLSCSGPPGSVVRVLANSAAIGTIIAGSEPWSYLALPRPSSRVGPNWSRIELVMNEPSGGGQFACGGVRLD